MLRIYTTALEMVREVAQVTTVIGRYDKDLCRQLRRCSVSVALNIAEGAAVRDGRRRVRYGDALGSALETRAGMEVAQAIGYIETIDETLQGHFRHIIGVPRTTAPQLPATEVLTELQLRILRVKARDPFPDNPSTVDACFAVARLGGFLKYNGKPGWQVLGRGLEKLLLMEEGAAALAAEM